MKNVAEKTYTSQVIVSAVDAFGTIHTSTANIVLTVGSVSFDIYNFFQENPLVLVLIVVAVVGVSGVALLNRRRR